jgi:Mn2+/Fe2+ NRAMP family transporter
LPIILFFGAWIIFGTKLQSSISAYYHTKLGDVLVGSLFAFGVFLFSYKGWDKDYIFARFGCVFAIGVALFPTNAKGADFTFVTLLHFVFTLAFFVTLIYFCLKLFVKSDQEKPYKRKKRRRNKIYRVCGWVMIICMVGIAINFIIPGADEWLGGSLVFFMETFAIWAFGISWFTKGETLKYLRD